MSKNTKHAQDVAREEPTFPEWAPWNAIAEAFAICPPDEAIIIGRHAGGVGVGRLRHCALQSDFRDHIQRMAMPASNRWIVVTDLVKGGPDSIHCLMPPPPRAALN